MLLLVATLLGDCFLPLLVAPIVLHIVHRALLLRVTIEPLQKVDIVLELSLGQFIDGDDFIQLQLLEAIVQDLQVACELVWEFGIEIQLRQRNHVGMDGIYDLAISNPVAAHLDSRVIALCEIIQPLQQLQSGQVALSHRPFLSAKNCDARMLWVP